LPDWSGDPPRPHPYTAANSSLIVDNTNNHNFPIDEWPSLGFVTYTGRYGTSPRQVVMRVVPGSPAANAGFEKGDVILSINGKSAPSAAALSTILEQSKGQFTAQVWEVGTGHFRTLTGKFDPNVRPPSSPPMGTPTGPSDSYDEYE
jgi:S1-C subfamily serine protease